MLVIAALFAVSTTQIWSATADDVAAAESERDGVAFLRQVTGLVSELAEAQSTAVRGGTVQTSAVRSAIGRVDVADRKLGDSLDAHQRWTDARKAINDVLAASPAGPGAYDQYSEATALLVQLSRHVADASRLVLDPEIGSFYLMDTAVVRLPDVIVDSGRAADLAVLAPGAGPGDDPAQTRISVARFSVATSTEAIGIGLSKAFDASDSQSLGTNITGQLDAFRTAVDEFVPSGTRLRSLDAMDAAALTRTAATVRQTARPLAEAVFNELENLLKTRVGQVALHRMLSVSAAGLSLLLILAMVGMLISRLRGFGEESLRVSRTSLTVRGKRGGDAQ
jgi:hypothetical protein